MLKKILRYFFSLFALTGTAQAQEEWKIVESRISDIRPGFHLQRIALSRGEMQVVLHLAVFDSDKYRLAVHDFGAEGPANLAQAARKADAVAAINAGYFHPDNSPVGLVVSGGEVIHPQERASLLSGVFAANAENLYLLRPVEFKLGPRTLDALQAGPYLVDKAEKVFGLNNTRKARRTFVLTDGGKQWAVGVCFSATLAELGEILIIPKLIPGIKIQRALNFDGGSSTGFWARRSGEPLHFRELARIRNSLLVIPR